MRSRAISWVGSPVMSAPSNAIPPDRARLAEDRHHQRRLAGAVGADQRHDLSGVDGEIDTLQRLDLAIGGAQVADREQRGGRRGHVPLSITASASSSSAPR
jgi:hypothetical protein